MQINNVAIPIEIIKIILLSISDTKCYLNSRLVCKNWYNILKDGRIYDNNKLFQTIIFNNNINIYNLKNQLIKEIIFKSYGDYIIKYYTYTCDKQRLKKKIIHNAPNKTNEIEYQGELIFCKTTFDIKNSIINKINYPMYHPCIIS